MQSLSATSYEIFRKKCILAKNKCCRSHWESDSCFKVSTSAASFSFDVKELDCNVETSGFDQIVVEVDPVKENHVLEDNHVQIESLSQHEDVENRVTSKVEIEITVPTEKVPLKKTSSANCEPSVSTVEMKPSASSTKASVNRARVHPFTPARPRTPANLRKENNPALSSNKSVKDVADKRRPTPSPLHMSLNLTPSRIGDTTKTARPIFSPRFAAGLTKTQKACSSPLPSAKLQDPVTPLPDTRIRDLIRGRVNGICRSRDKHLVKRKCTRMFTLKDGYVCVHLL